ncbi:TPA: sigma-70 family RNA polymerase sigma factor [Candidatus Galligastranaerophilus intestinavium]|uniref:Sigma-70 family RNA polymerase sigma factor n=1 Tax=Candidatus Galligastranaerophilus intestinavium TaxID=2840836 RepID=A0A9D1FHB2_9BACT|nr:sigma-70 family RNA polymerase sigma factor [Candidatus Galligastranaerophilus intestinavium]
MKFSELIEQNKQNVRNIIKKITNEQNEDIEQEVYIKVWQNRDKYEEKGKLKGWIGTIAKNLAKDYLKSSYVKNRTDLDEEKLNEIKDKKTTPELKLVQNERQKTIIQAINNLKPKLKEIILLCEIEGNTYETVSKKLKIPLGTVKSRLYNAKKELAQSLKDLL